MSVSRSLFAFMIRFFSSSLSPNFNDFPAKRTAANYDDFVKSTAHQRDFKTPRYLLNKRVTDACFNTTNTVSFITISHHQTVAPLIHFPDHHHSNNNNSNWMDHTMRSSSQSHQQFSLPSLPHFHDLAGGSSPVSSPAFFPHYYGGRFHGVDSGGGSFHGGPDHNLDPGGSSFISRKPQTQTPQARVWFLSR